MFYYYYYLLLLLLLLLFIIFRPLLGELLPQLGVLIHDKTENVRNLVLKLLFKLKSIKIIKFHQIVSVRNLLLRLPLENERNVSLITYLLLKSYFPTDKSAVEQIQRSLQLSDENFNSALIFFTESVKVKFLMFICLFIFIFIFIFLIVLFFLPSILF